MKIALMAPVWGAYIQWLPSFIENMESQTGVELQIICIDNASEVPISGLPDHVQVIRTEERLSVGACRNLAIRATDCPLIACTDIDDVFPPGYFSFAARRMQANPNLVACGVRPWKWNPETGEKHLASYPPQRAIDNCHRKNLFPLWAMLTGPKLVMSGTVFRTDAVREAGGYCDFNFREDSNLAYLLPFLGEVEIHPGPGRLKRDHPDSLMRQPRSRESLEAAYASGRRRLKDHPRVPFYAKALLPWMKRKDAQAIAQQITS